MTTSKGDEPGKEREFDNARSGSSNPKDQAGAGNKGEQPCCDPQAFAHGHPHGAAFRRGWQRMMHGAGVCCGPTPVQVNIVLPEQFSCCSAAQDCCAEEECCSEEQPATDK